MLYHRLRRVFLAGCASAVLFTFLAALSPAAEKPNIEGKVVLANLDRYDATIRFGSTRRDIKPKKASVLSPKKYPVTIEYWSGNTRSGWRTQAIAAAGIYGFNFKNGTWTLTQLKRGKTTRPPQPSRTVLQQRVVRQPVRRLPINADRRRWSPLARAAWVATSIYQFVRDEQDRDLLRELLIRGREEDLRELERWLDDSVKIALPHKQELREAFDELKALTDEDWKEIETADEQDWEQARADLGGLISEDDWKNVTDDFAEIDTGDYWQDNVEVDLDQIEFADNLDADGSIDVGEDLDLAENVDVGDLGVDTEHYDLGGYDDFGGYDGAYGVDPGDFGGGGDFGGDFGDNDFGDFGGGDFDF